MRLFHFKAMRRQNTSSVMATWETTMGRKETALPPKTIRYYEDIQLIRPARARNGYRDYSDQDVHRLRFLQRARSLGFTIEECRLLLSLYGGEHHASADVKAIATQKIREIDQKINELNSLKSTLVRLEELCHGNDRPESPIINDLSRRSGDQMARRNGELWWRRDDGPRHDGAGLW